MNTEKSPDAFRTISEVADWLGTPAHVLRFWESRFPQIKPVKRAGGRRYYRPADMELLGGIKKLLHDDGMTIRGVQKLLRENGVRRVADLSPPLAADLADALLRDREQSVDADAPDTRTTAAAPRDAGPAPQFAPTPAPADGRALSGEPDAPMAADIPPDAPEPADVLPFVLSPRARADATAPPVSPAAPPPAAVPSGDTPDLFDRLDPVPATPDSPPDTAGPRLRLPAIPPDPTDADPLPGHGPRRPAIPRRASHRPDDRLVQLFHRLDALRGRMDRADP